MAWFVDIWLFLLTLFKDWLYTIFVVPFKNTDMLWLLVPVWLAWAFAEFFQEKRGTSLGNAISNAVITVWASVDCIRQTVYQMGKHAVVGFWNVFARFTIIGIIFAFGALVVYFGIKGNELTKRVGRIRIITYVFVMFVPVFYNAIPLTWYHVFAAALFFPLFYYAIELIDVYTPDPKSISETEGKTDPFAVKPLQQHQQPPVQHPYRPNQPLNQGPRRF